MTLDRGGFAVDAGHSGCTLGTLSYTTQTNGGSGWNVPAKVGAVNGTLADMTLDDEGNAYVLETTAGEGSNPLLRIFDRQGVDGNVLTCLPAVLYCLICAAATA